MLTEVMNSVKNHFAIDRATGELHGYETGEFTLDSGKISVINTYLVNQYIAITGSVLNNGVYKVRDFSDGIITIEEHDSNDKIWGETFSGTIYSLHVPEGFIQLVDRIKAFAESKEGQSSNIVNASFGIQSQSFGTDQNGVRAGWKTVFRNELHAYRRMFDDIVI